MKSLLVEQVESPRQSFLSTQDEAKKEVAFSQGWEGGARVRRHGAGTRARGATRRRNEGRGVLRGRRRTLNDWVCRLSTCPVSKSQGLGSAGGVRARAVVPSDGTVALGKKQEEDGVGYRAWSGPRKAVAMRS